MTSLQESSKIHTNILKSFSKDAARKFLKDKYRSSKTQCRVREMMEMLIVLLNNNYTACILTTFAALMAHRLGHLYIPL